MSSLTEVDGFTKDLKKINIKNCNNSSCGTETDPPVDLCFLYDGSSPRDTHFKLTNNDELNLIIKLNKTGYAE